jgi:hypothetical protein
VNDGGAETDTGGQAGTDSGGSAGTDSSQAGTDSGGAVNDGGQAGTDSGNPVCVEATAGEYSGVLTSGTPLSVGGYTFEYLGKTGVNTEFRISCGGSVVDEQLICVLGEVTTKVVEADRMSISIKPIAAGTEVVNAQISVVETQ